MILKGEKLRFDIIKVVNDEFDFRRFISTALFKYYLEKFKEKGGVIRSTDSTDLIQGELDGITWFLENIHYENIYAGSLAPFEEEPYEFN
ncbi:MAG: hypothetical protein QXJ64_10315 [Thermosphaera sp.]